MIVQLINSVVLIKVYRIVIQFYTHIYLFFFKFFPHFGYHRIFSRAPCAMQQVLAVYLFYFLFMMKTLILGISQLDSVQLISILLVTSKVSQSGASWTHARLLPSVRPDEGADLSLISVIEPLHGLFNLLLVGLDVHTEYQCGVVFYFLHG